MNRLPNFTDPKPSYIQLLQLRAWSIQNRGKRAGSMHMNAARGELLKQQLHYILPVPSGAGSKRLGHCRIRGRTKTEGFSHLYPLFFTRVYLQDGSVLSNETWHTYSLCPWLDNLSSVFWKSLWFFFMWIQSAKSLTFVKISIILTYLKTKSKIQKSVVPFFILIV